MPALIILRAFGSSVLTALSKLSAWQLLLIVALAFAGIQTIRLKSEQRHSAHLDVQLRKTVEARAADQIAYRKAQADAAAANQAQVQHVEQQYQRNSDNEREAYLRDLAKLRADRVRQRSAAPQGSANGSGASQDSAATSGADGDGLQVHPPADVQEDAAEIELRLMHLQNWVREQLSVDPNLPARDDHK